MRKAKRKTQENSLIKTEPVRFERSADAYAKPELFRFDRSAEPEAEPEMFRTEKSKRRNRDR